MVKNPPASAGDMRDTSSIPGLGRFPRGGHGNTFQYSYLENSMGRGTWWATVHGLQKVEHNWVTECTHTHTEDEPGLMREF